MAPTPQELFENSSRHHGLSGDEVVISGMAGLFPKSDNVVQFMENLYNHVDMVEPTSSSFKHPELPNFIGKINGFNKFDGQFFKTPHGQSNFFVGMGRKLLEQTYGAIFDAGINPISLAGGRVGVFIGSSFADQAMLNLFDMKVSVNQSYLLTGASKTMLANRISYWIDGKAASYTIDQNCASFTVCLEHAYWSIRNGLCDAAIIGGCNHCIHPMLSMNFNRAGVLNSDGKTKCFDKNGDGFVRSEACGTFFLQKAKDAKRIYCEVYYAKEKFFTGPYFDCSLVRKSDDLEKFLQEFYDEIDVSPEMVEYIEANAPGIAEADGNELEAIANLFAKNKPVKVGCVKSNLGHGEAASGFCSLAKICLANQTGKLPANLHYYEPQNNIAAVRDGRIQIVTENIRFNRGYVGLNTFSFSGVNVHVLLKSHYKIKDIDRYKGSIPRLVLASARTESCLNKLLNHLKNKPIDPEEIALLHNFYNIDIPGHTTRGYVILDINKNNETIKLSESSQLYPGVRRPVWFMYSGMGSQWPAMGAALMSIPVFAAAIERCRKILEPKGVDIVRILTESDKTIFDNILHSFVGIAAVQIALTDILQVLGIVPDNIIGHSVGELGCAYADGGFTADEMILASYYRGLVSVQTEFCKGSMAAVGLGYKDISPMCPSEIDIACHNSSESCTISGPSEHVKKFVAELKTRGVFAKEVNTANIAYHSRYIAQAGGALLSKMKEFITTPKLRSKKWLSSSVLPENWNKTEARYCSAEYFTNNLLNAVYFEEVATRIPSEAIVIEISPHGLMQAILKRSHARCTNVPLTRREHHDSASFLLQAIGKLYENGLNPKIDMLYPRVEFPVSTETPMLSQLVEWEHSDDWPLQRCVEDIATASAREVILSVHDDEWSFMKDHVRDGIAVIPEAVILCLVWETLGMHQGINYNNSSVCFTDVEFRSTVNVVVEDVIKLNINIMKGSGTFQVTSEDMVIANGYINIYDSDDKSVDVFELEKTDMQLNSKDVYTIMSLRGHSYGSKIQSIHSCNFKRNIAQLKWNGDWVMFLDSLMQLSALETDHTHVVTPVYINKLSINTLKHKEALDDGKYIARVIGNETKMIRCGGVKLNNIVFYRTPVITKDEYVELLNPIMETTDVPQAMKLSISAYGDIDKLSWIKYNSIKRSTLVQVSYAGISLRDCHKAVGSLPDDYGFGIDYSGINDRGERIMGVVRGGAMATSVEADLDLLWPVPEFWSLEDAATVPHPYLLVYYTLTIRSHIRKNHNILIMDGGSPLGQAFISVCLDLNCNVFATVSNIEEKNFLQKMYPSLKEENIIDHRTTCVYTAIVFNTKKLLCNFVVNCGFGGSREVGLKCVGDCGIFLDIIEVSERIVLGMAPLSNERNIYLVHLPNLFRHENLDEKRVLQAKISEGIARGVVRPLTRVVYSPTNVSTAFRLFSSNKSISRVLVNIKDLETSHYISLPRITTYSDGTYVIIVCDPRAGGVGIELIDRLVHRGAKNFVLYCTTQSGYLQYKLHLWNTSGISVSLSCEYLRDEDSCRKLIEGINSKGQVHGIFTVEEVSTKVDLKHSDDPYIVDNVDEVSRKLCPELRSFVVIALTSSDDKNQRILFEREKTCQLRRQKGLPSIVFQIELPKQQTGNIEDWSMNTSSEQISMMFKSLESAIQHVSDATFAINNEPTSVYFMQKITKILGIKNIDDFDDNTTLKALGVNNIVIQEIKALINTLYQKNYSLEHLQQMTISSIMSLGDKYYKKIEKKSGLDALISYVDPDECRAAESVVVMSTACNKHMIGDEARVNMDSTETYLFMIPGFGGHQEDFPSTLCDRLKIPAVTFQTGSEFHEDNIPGIAMRIMKSIKKSFNLKTKFYILGYSFGVNVALELASLIEKEGHTGIVYCLDTSPDVLKIQMDQYLGKLNDEDLQNVIINHMYRLFSGRKDDFRQELKEMQNWNAKMEFCIAKLRIYGYSSDYMKCTIQGFYEKIKAARVYKPKFKLQSEVVLVKGTLNQSASLASEAADYGLCQYSEQPVRVVDVQSDVTTVPHDCRLANIVNRLLDPHILQEYRQKNLCNTYYV